VTQEEERRMPSESQQMRSLIGEGRDVSRAVRVALRILGNLPCQMEILRLIKHPAYAEILPVSPRFFMKYAADDYLLRDLTVPQRKCCFVHHYSRLRDELPDAMLRRILHASIPVFERRECESVYRVVTHLSRQWDKEGELSLSLEVDGVDIYVISFTLVPGSIVDSRAAEVLLISRLQGVRGTYELIRQATRGMYDVAPASVLLSALQGFSEAFGIHEIVGASAVRQSAYTKWHAEEFRKAYDEFFNDQGAVMGPDDLFNWPVPLPEKPLQEIKRGHKLRTKEKRAFKHEVSEAVRRFFLQNRRSEIGQSDLEDPRLEQTLHVPMQLHFADC
jgi:uncharacterized protein VirK/YbjX